MLESPWHEDRLLALILMVERRKRSPPEEADRIARAFLRHRRRVNQWDLVDTSAPGILGPFVERHGASVLDALATSDRLWDRRIAMVATQYLIRKGDLEAAFRLADRLVDDSYDLIHKAVGWMLREAGDRDIVRLRAFLGRHAATMPRTTLRYAIENLPPQERARWRGMRAPQAKRPAARKTLNRGRAPAWDVAA